MSPEKKSQAQEREYIIPLRKEFLKVPRYKRSQRAIKTIKEFIAKHMKVPERDTKKVKLDIYLNNEIFFRGMKKPPAKIKVRAKKEGEIVQVSFAETPEHIKFLKLKHSKKHKKPEKKPEPVVSKPAEEKSEQEKKEEKEKEQSVAQLREQQASFQAKAEKHLTSPKETQSFRKALKK